MSWHKDRFEPSKSKIRQLCEICKTDYWLPPSKAKNYKTCNKECAKILRDVGINARMRKCETCNKDFSPRQTQIDKGHGRFCSQKCNTAFHQAGNTEEVNKRKADTMRRLRAAGKVKILRGKSNPNWKGGRQASKERWIKSGKANECLRKYRKNNPDKVKEFSRRRADKKLDRLPYGTIPKLRSLQGGLCVYCKISISKKSHLDHIMPLALGGKHEAGNLQLLCPSCNLRKSNKHPDVFAKEFAKASPKAAEIRAKKAERA